MRRTLTWFYAFWMLANVAVMFLAVEVLAAYLFWSWLRG